MRANRGEDILYGRRAPAGRTRKGPKVWIDTRSDAAMIKTMPERLVDEQRVVFRSPLLRDPTDGSEFQVVLRLGRSGIAQSANFFLFASQGPRGSAQEGSSPLAAGYERVSLLDVMNEAIAERLEQGYVPDDPAAGTLVTRQDIVAAIEQLEP